MGLAIKIKINLFCIVCVLSVWDLSSPGAMFKAREYLNKA
jgi:hypothetical protein